MKTKNTVNIGVKIEGLVGAWGLGDTMVDRVTRKVETVRVIVGTAPAEPWLVTKGIRCLLKRKIHQSIEDRP